MNTHSPNTQLREELPTRGRREGLTSDATALGVKISQPDPLLLTQNTTTATCKEEAHEHEAPSWGLTHSLLLPEP